MEFKWLNEGEIVNKDKRIEIIAPAQTDSPAEALMNVKKGFSRNRFATIPITIRKSRGILFSRSRSPMTSRTPVIPRP